MAEYEAAILEFISRRYNGGQPVDREESLFFSGMIDSLGIQELAQFLRTLGGRAVTATEIVEDELDNARLLAARLAGGGG